MAYYQTQPLVPNAFYVDIIGGSATQNSASGASAVTALTESLSNVQAVFNPTTQTAAITYLTAFSPDSGVTLQSNLTLPLNVQLGVLQPGYGGGAGFVSLLGAQSFLGINGGTGSIQAGFAGSPQMTMSTGATHYVSTNGVHHRLTVEGAVYASTYHTLCPYRLFVGKDKQVMHITESGDVGFGTTEPAAQLHVIGNVLNTGNIWCGGTIEVERDIVVRGNLIVEGNLEVRGDMGVHGDVQFNRDLDVSGYINGNRFVPHMYM